MNVTTTNLASYEILNYIEEGIIILDTKGCIRFWNNWMSSYTNRVRKDVLGVRFDDLFPEVDGVLLKRKIKVCLRVQVPNFFFNLKTGWFVKIPFRKLTGSPFRFMQQHVTLYLINKDSSKGDIFWCIYGI